MPQLCLGYSNDTIFAFNSTAIVSHNVMTNATTTSPAPALSSSSSSSSSLPTQLCSIAGQLSLLSNAQNPALVQVFNTSSSIASPWLSMTLAAPSSSDQFTSMAALSSQCVAAITKSSSGSSPRLVLQCGSDGDPQSHSLTPASSSSTPTIPIVATDQRLSSLYLLGYPNTTSISYFDDVNSAIKDPSSATHVFATTNPLSTLGSAQALNQDGTHMMLFDNNRTIQFIEMNPATQYASVATQVLPSTVNGNVIAIGDISITSSSLFYAVTPSSDGNYVFGNPVTGSSSVQTRDGPSSSPSVSNDTSNATGPNLSAIIGSAVAGGVVLGIVCVLLYCWARRRKRQRQAKTDYFGMRSGGKQQRLPSQDNLDGLYMDQAAERGVMRERAHAGDAAAGGLLVDHMEDDFDIEDEAQDEFDAEAAVESGISATLYSHSSAQRHLSTSSGMPTRDNSFRQRINSFLDRMSSIRSGVMPLSPNSLTGSLAFPVEDRYQKVKQLHMNQINKIYLDPMVVDKNDTLIFNGRFQLTDELPMDDENPRLPGYATRSIMQVSSGTVRTLHYFTSETRDAFMRNVNTSLTMRRSRFIVRHHRAAALPAPLASGHQYYWISSPALGRNSLHYLLHHDAATVDAREHTFLVLSVQSILRGVAKVHAADYCHLGLSPRSFFYEQASTITDWLLSGFYQAYVLGQNDGHPLYLDVYSAPELIVASVVSDDHQDVMLLCHRFRAQFEMDAWSVGCILYQLLTGEPLFKDIMQLRVLCGMDPATSTDLQNHLDKAFQHPALNDFPPVTQKLLNIDPQLRIPVSHILREWVEVHSLAEYQ